MSRSTHTDQMGRDGEGGATYLVKGERGITFLPDRTALLVIDPANDWFSDGGAGWDLAKTTLKMHDVLGNQKKAIDGARERRIPVLFAPMAFTGEDYARDELPRRSGINRIMLERKMFLAGSWGADFPPDLRPNAEDIVVFPHKGIDVFETDLPDHLHRMGIAHLVIAGMSASLCCESTGRHAMEEGYDTTFLSDAIGSESLASYEAAVHLSYPMIANTVMKVEEFLARRRSGEPISVAAAVGARGVIRDRARCSVMIEPDEISLRTQSPPRPLLSRDLSDARTYAAEVA